MPAPTPDRFIVRTIAALLALASLTAFVPQPSYAGASEPPGVTSRQRTEKKIFTDSEIIDGFLKTAFGAEYHLAGRVDRIRKYEIPVRVFAEGRADRKAQIAKVVTDIARRGQHLNIAMADNRD